MEYVIAIAVLVIVVYFAFLKDASSSSGSRTTTPDVVVDTASEVVADANNNGITSKAELKNLTKVQLFEFAEKQNLKVKKSGTKAQVINQIHSQLR